MDRKLIVAELAGVGLGAATVSVIDGLIQRIGLPTDAIFQPEPEVDSPAAIEPPTYDAPYANVSETGHQAVGQGTVNKDSAVDIIQELKKGEVNINCSAARSPDRDTGALLTGAREHTLECNEPPSPLDLGAATLFNDAILSVCATTGGEGIRARPYGTHELFEYVDFSVDGTEEK